MIWQTYKYDCLRNLKYGFAYQHKNENLKANLLMVIHTIEKGLTMPNAHTNFGKDRIYSLIFLVKQLTNNHSDNKNIFEVQYALSTLNDYILFHKMRNKEIEPTLLDCIQQLTQSLSYSLGQDKYAQYFFTNETFFKFAQSDFREFALSRHSVRNYIDEEIPDEILTKVIEIANTSPSSCNRQTCQAYIIKNKNLIQKVSSVQGGCRGFGDLAVAIIVVTSKLTSFYDMQDRLQPSINAGFYGMNLLYALHYYHIGACVLNWSYTKKRDLQLRELLPQIKDEEQICFLISCGYPADKFSVALSKRDHSKKTYIIK